MERPPKEEEEEEEEERISTSNQRVTFASSSIGSGGERGGGGGTSTPTSALKGTRQSFASSTGSINSVRFSPDVTVKALPHWEREAALETRKGEWGEAPPIDELWDGEEKVFWERELTPDELKRRLMVRSLRSTLLFNLGYAFNGLVSNLKKRKDPPDPNVPYCEADGVDQFKRDVPDFFSPREEEIFLRDELMELCVESTSRLSEDDASADNEAFAVLYKETIASKEELESDPAAGLKRLEKAIDEILDVEDFRLAVGIFVGYGERKELVDHSPEGVLLRAHKEALKIANEDGRKLPAVHYGDELSDEMKEAHQREKERLIESNSQALPAGTELTTTTKQFHVEETKEEETKVLFFLSKTEMLLNAMDANFLSIIQSCIPDKPAQNVAAENEQVDSLPQPDDKLEEKTENTVEDAEEIIESQTQKDQEQTTFVFTEQNSIRKLSFEEYQKLDTQDYIIRIFVSISVSIFKSILNALFDEKVNIIKNEEEDNKRWLDGILRPLPYLLPLLILLWVSSR